MPKSRWPLRARQSPTLRNQQLPNRSRQHSSQSPLYQLAQLRPLGQPEIPLRPRHIPQDLRLQRLGRRPHLLRPQA